MQAQGCATQSHDSQYRPAVKFQKISKDTLERLQICTNDESGNPNPELEESEDEELEDIEEVQKENTPGIPTLNTATVT